MANIVAATNEIAIAITKFSIVLKIDKYVLDLPSNLKKSLKTCSNPGK